MSIFIYTEQSQHKEFLHLYECKHLKKKTDSSLSTKFVRAYKCKRRDEMNSTPKNHLRISLSKRGGDTRLVA